MDSYACEPLVVVTHWVHPEVIEALERFCKCAAPTERDVLPRAEVRTRLGGAAGVVVCMADHVDEEFLDAGPGLRIVSATLKGYDNIDVDACTRRGIWVTILPDHLTAPAAELTMALILGLLRRVGEGDGHVRGGRYAGWRPRLYGATLQDSTVGVIGMGKVGRALAARLKGFGTRILYSDTAPLPPGTESDLGARRVELAELLAASDIVVPLVPLTPSTRGLLDAAALARMPAGAYLVNVGRGSVVDELAVARALDSGRLAGYAADVFAMEDWALPDRPREIPRALLDHPRTLFTPHLGTAVDGVRRKMSLAAVRQVREALAGRRPEYAINEVQA
ncbi:hydroxyacid dehydrogenase [Actinomadura sp. KC216]|uniref:NAD(P)-dependent oxidoreductase n=1 Tax=Actinomadura sp. KC216 TaxID=2530370 RepID=UPI001047A159|nr:NAD(P)-dependent oxidoreductase [Actinomadura sp. KC216]TDB87920.1 hydroxyacid dehydrogenase [Actinomadura sp. KC216]